jgi:hypothetical protein
MTTRFDKALAQVAQAESDLKADRLARESRAQKVRRLEDLIRAKEATGDRIVIGIGAALVVSSMALPVYAAYLREAYVYLPKVGETLLMRSGASADQPQTTSSVHTDARERAAPHTSMPTDAISLHSQSSDRVPYTRYVVHRATEASALIEGPSGLWWVTPGMKIPGAGQILSIERSTTGWAVVTSETTITEAFVNSATN